MIRPIPTLSALALSALAGLAGCTAEDQLPAIEGSLTVHAGRVGLVRVGPLAAVVDPLTSADLFGVGAGPRYTVRFDHPDGVLWLTEVLGPAVDLRAIEPGVTVLRGVRTALEIPLERGLGQTVEVVAVAADQVVRAEVSGDRARLEVPTSGAVVILGLWRSAGRAEALGRLSLAQAGAPLPEGLRLSPNIPLREGLVADLVDAPAAWITAELTWDGLRTGLVLGGGLAGEPAASGGPRAGARLPRPDAAVGARAGILIEARLRSVGEPLPVAVVAEHLAVSATGVSLQVPPPLSLAPVPGAAPDGAGLFSVNDRSLSWRNDEPPTAVVLTLRGTSGCDDRRWVVAGDGDPAGAAGARLTVPEPDDHDLLAAPLIQARITARWYSGLSYDRLLIPEMAQAVSLPRRSSRRAERSQTGWWRGGAPGCAADGRQGRYAARSLAADCPAGRSAVELIVDRCGQVVPLSPPGDGPNLCGRLAEDRFLPRGGGPGGPVIEEDGGALILALPGARWRLEPVGAVGVRPPAALRGDWYQVELSERAVSAEGLGAATLLLRGGADGGPWLHFGDDGRVRFASGALRFSGRLTELTDAEGLIEDEGAGCADEPRRWSLRLTPEGQLLLSARLGARQIELRAGRR